MKKLTYMANEELQENENNDKDFNTFILGSSQEEKGTQ